MSSARSWTGFLPSGGPAGPRRGLIALGGFHPRAAASPPLPGVRGVLVGFCGQLVRIKSRSRCRPAPRSLTVFLGCGSVGLDLRDEALCCTPALRGWIFSPTQEKKKKRKSFEFWQLAAHKLFQNAV